MIKVNIKDKQRDEARILLLTVALNNSITKGAGNMAGALGEVIVKDHYSGTVCNTYDFDIKIADYKIDVKTKRFDPKFTPLDSWLVSVSDFNTKQKCDYYCFCGISNDYGTGYIYGLIEKAKFYQLATFGKKGDIDPQGNGVFRFKGDCYNLRIDKLKT